MRRFIMLVALVSVTCLGFGSALVMAGSKEGTGQIGVRHVAVQHHAAGRAAATLTVGCGGGPPNYSTVQAAVTAAAPNDTIMVCDGTYTEQVTIPAAKDGLTLVAQSNKAIIKAPLPLTGQNAIVEVVGAKNVTISGFTISGPGGNRDIANETLKYGVLVDGGASVTLDSNDILHIRDEPFSGNQGRGWAVGAGTLGGSDSGSVTATNNHITDFQRAAFLLKGAAGSVDTITDNTMVGAGQTDVIAQNVIQISDGANATVSGNTISDAYYTPTSNVSTGILLYNNSGEVTVKDNTFNDNEINVYVTGKAASGKITISGNTIHRGDEGIHVEASSGVQVLNNTTDKQAHYGLLATESASVNTFDGNNASGVTGVGNYDCADMSKGDRTEGTANTWTNNSGHTVTPFGICSPTLPPPVTSTTTTTQTMTVTVTVPATTVTVPPQTITHSATVTLPEVTVTTPGQTTVVTVPPGQSTTTVTIPGQTVTRPTETKTTVVTVTDPSHQVLLPPHVVKQIVKFKARVRTIFKTLAKACQNIGLGKG